MGAAATRPSLLSQADADHSLTSGSPQRSRQILLARAARMIVLRALNVLRPRSAQSTSTYSTPELYIYLRPRTCVHDVTLVGRGVYSELHFYGRSVCFSFTFIIKGSMSQRIFSLLYWLLHSLTTTIIRSSRSFDRLAALFRAATLLQAIWATHSQSALLQLTL